MARVLLSVAIAGVVAILPLVVGPARLLVIPGALLSALLGSITVSSFPRHDSPLEVLNSFLVWSLILVGGPMLWKWGRGPKEAQNTRFALAAWIALSIPWMLLFPFAVGMAFEGGETAEAYTLVVSMWSYPVFLIAAIAFRKWATWVVALPLLSVVGFFVSGFLH